MISLIDAEKHSTKPNTKLLINKVWNIIKGVCEKTTADIIFHGEKLQAFLSDQEQGQDTTPTLPRLFN
jgi:hypothetical protein